MQGAPVAGWLADGLLAPCWPLGLVGGPQVRLRRLLIDMVLATDMKQHFNILSKFQAKLQVGGEGGGGEGRVCRGRARIHGRQPVHRVHASGIHR